MDHINGRWSSPEGLIPKRQKLESKELKDCYLTVCFSSTFPHISKFLTLDFLNVIALLSRQFYALSRNAHCWEKMCEKCKIVKKVKPDFPLFESLLSGAGASEAKSLFNLAEIYYRGHFKNGMEKSLYLLSNPKFSSDQTSPLLKTKSKLLKSIIQLNHDAYSQGEHAIFRMTQDANLDTTSRAYAHVLFGEISFTTYHHVALASKHFQAALTTENAQPIVQIQAGFMLSLLQLIYQVGTINDRKAYEYLDIASKTPTFSDANREIAIRAKKLIQFSNRKIAFQSEVFFKNIALFTSKNSEVDTHQYWKCLFGKYMSFKKTLPVSLFSQFFAAVGKAEPLAILKLAKIYYRMKNETVRLKTLYLLENPVFLDPQTSPTLKDKSFLLKYTQLYTHGFSRENEKIMLKMALDQTKDLQIKTFAHVLLGENSYFRHFNIKAASNHFLKVINALEANPKIRIHAFFLIAILQLKHHDDTITDANAFSYFYEALNSPHINASNHLIAKLGLLLLFKLKRLSNINIEDGNLLEYFQRHNESSTEDVKNSFLAAYKNINLHLKGYEKPTSLGLQ